MQPLTHADLRDGIDGTAPNAYSWELVTRTSDEVLVRFSYTLYGSDSGHSESLGPDKGSFRPSIAHLGPDRLVVFQVLDGEGNLIPPPAGQALGPLDARGRGRADGGPGRVTVRREDGGYRVYLVSQSSARRAVIASFVPEGPTLSAWTEVGGDLARRHRRRSHHHVLRIRLRAARHPGRRCRRDPLEPIVQRAPRRCRLPSRLRFRPRLRRHRRRGGGAAGDPASRDCGGATQPGSPASRRRGAWLSSPFREVRPSWALASVLGGGARRLDARAACGAPSQRCEQDIDCNTGRVCVLGRCQPAGTGALTRDGSDAPERDGAPEPDTTPPPPDGPPAGGDTPSDAGGGPSPPADSANAVDAPADADADTAEVPPADDGGAGTVAPCGPGDGGGCDGTPRLPPRPGPVAGGRRGGDHRSGRARGALARPLRSGQRRRPGGPRGTPRTGARWRQGGSRSTRRAPGPASAAA